MRQSRSALPFVIATLTEWVNQLSVRMSFSSFADTDDVVSPSSAPLDRSKEEEGSWESKDGESVSGDREDTFIDEDGSCSEDSAEKGACKSVKCMFTTCTCHVKKWNGIAGVPFQRQCVAPPTSRRRHNLALFDPCTT